MISAGALNRRVAIQQRTSTRGEKGSQSDVWTTVSITWASIDVQMSQLEYSTSEFVDKTTYRVTMRYRRDIVFDDALRLQYTDNMTGIAKNLLVKVPINVGEANIVLLLICEEFDGQE